LRDLARELADYARTVQASPDQLERVSERLYRLEQLLRRHGPTMDDLLGARSALTTKLSELGAAAERLPEVRAQLDSATKAAATTAGKLSRARRKTAKQLASAISAQLGDLGMGEARVVVDVRRRDHERARFSVDGMGLAADGVDRVEFLIAPNKGMDPRPLGRIASGGELSRALLALKRALIERVGDELIGVQVFDEVDAGVGGQTADRIGRAMAAVAPKRQVLCITHLASIAAYADAHFVVQKEQGNTATSRIERASGRARVTELARMLTGNCSNGSLKAARELLARAARPAALCAVDAA